MIAVLVWIAAAALGVAVTGAPAEAATAYPPSEEGTTGHPFTLLQPVPGGVTVLGGDDERLELARLPLTDLDPSAPMWAGYPAGERPDPRMAVPLDDGHILISGGKDVPYVMEVDDQGNIVWQYRDGVDGLLRKPFSAEPATFGGRRCVLISDRIACRVFAVTRDDAKEVVWQYGATDTPGAGVNRLADPFCATQVPAAAGQVSGNVLIADSNDNHRVLEVCSDDYAAAAADLGYRADSVVWQYGVTGAAGVKPGYLFQARSPQRLPGGDTLITDAYGKRIIRVRSADYDPSAPDNGYDASSIVWSYENGVDGSLLDPNTARFVAAGGAAGTIVATDCDSSLQRVVLIDYATKALAAGVDLKTFARPSYVSGTDSASPRDARFDSHGALWIADAGFGRVLRVGYETSATVTSEPLDCGRPKMVKAFDRLKIIAPAQAAGASFSVQYSIDGLAFKNAKISSDGRNVNFPAGTSGLRFTYRITLSTTDRWVTPVFEGFTLHYVKAETGGEGGGGGPGNSGGSGVYTYPPSAEGGTGTPGAGTGSGASGTGSGSGTSGTGSGGSGAGTGSGSGADSLQPPMASTGSGPSVPVEGYRVEGEEGVSGVPLRAAEGPQAPAPERPGPPAPVLALVGAGMFVAAAFFAPWPVVAARMRGITGFDHFRPRSRGPSGSLWK
jgi:hypothetical protein